MTKPLKQTLTDLIQPGWPGHIAAALAGSLMVFGFAPYGLYVLIPLLLAILFTLIHRLEPKQALYRGWWFGMGYFGIGVSWVYVSIHVFGYAPVPLAVLFTVLFAAYLSLFTAGFAWLTQKATAKLQPVTTNMQFLLLMPAFWILLEWTRGWFLTGFPWLAIGYSQLPGPLAGIAPLLGVYGVSWLVVLFSGALVLLLKSHQYKYLGVIIAIVVFTGLLRNMEWTEAEGEPITVTLVQGNVAQEDKWKAAQVNKNLELYARLSQAHWDSDVIIWPEAAITAWYHQVKGGFLAEMLQQAEQSQTTLITGIPYYDFASRSMYNSVIDLGDDSNGIYHKVHLAPFGDYLPLDKYLRGLIDFFNLPMSSFSAGSADQALLTAAGQKVGISICYEDVFGEEVIKTLPEATFLVNVSNDSWWGDSFGPQQHMQIAAMRALETGRPLLRGTNNGVTGYVDHHGYIQQQLPQFVSDTLTVEIQPRRGETPYVRAGSNIAVITLMVLLLLLYGWRQRQN